MYQNILTDTTKKIYKDSYEKGYAFEQYVISLFNKQKFIRKKWRQSKKFTDSFQPFDHFNPDVEMELIFTGRRKYRFAVECKWQTKFKDGSIYWANDSQICAYRIFQSQARMPVFVAIGIGGEPSNPAKLFVTPLDNLVEYNHVTESQLFPFIKKPATEFNYNIHQLKLFQD